MADSLSPPVMVDACSRLRRPRPLRPSTLLRPRLSVSRWSRAAHEVVTGLQTLFSAAVYASLIVTFGFQVARVDGLSMAPTLEDHDRLIVSKLVYELGEPRPGDIVMLYYPVNPEKMFVQARDREGRRHGPNRRRPRVRQRSSRCTTTTCPPSSAATTTGARRSCSRATTSSWAITATTAPTAATGARCRRSTSSARSKVRWWPHPGRQLL